MIMKRIRFIRFFRLVVLVCAAGLAVAAGLYWQRSGRIDLLRGGAGGWTFYGQNEGGARYSALDQIDRGNVSQLEVAWEYHTGDRKRDGRYQTTFQTTPILIDGTLYLSTGSGRVIALDPETGRERWVFNLAIDMSVPRAESASRGVTAWLDANLDPGSPCRRRIFLATIDARLIALDGATGRRCPGFGSDGSVDLSAGVDLADYKVNRRMYGVTSPPVTIGDLVVVGSAIGDNRGVTLERGIIRAFDARTGRLAWAWDPVPKSPEDPAWRTWEDDSALRTGAGNVWAPMSVDSERDLVFVPTTSPSPDYFGGKRPGSNVYANSIVALRGSTGEVVWHYQLVHHDLWDYDLPAQPSLITVKRDGKDVPAVAQATKMGLLFVFNRETGEPLFPIEERKVPQTDVPGEKSWPTQPFPVRPAPLVPHSVSPEDAWGVTPWDRRKCSELISAHRNEGIYTPPGLKGSIQIPGIAGGTNWGGVAFDEGRGVAVLNMINLPFIITLVPREKGMTRTPRSMTNDMVDTPYLLRRDPLLSPLGLPCVRPPWGTIAAVDLNSGEIRWQVPLGTIRDLAPVPLPLELGVPGLGGPVITAGGLVFIGAAAESAFRAFDIDTGEVLWETRLPAGGQATPMTYRLGESGRQFVAIAAGGHGNLGSKLGDSIVAFALPDSRTGIFIGALRTVIPWMLAAILIAAVLTWWRNVIKSRWLWLVILSLAVLASTEYRWMMTQSISAMVLWFALGVVAAILLMKLRGLAVRSWIR